MTNFQIHKIGQDQSGVTLNFDENQSSIDISQHDYDQLTEQFAEAPQKDTQGYDVLDDQFNQALNETLGVKSTDSEVVIASGTLNANAEDQEFDNLLKDIGSVDINQFKDEISRIVKNPNPIALYSEINKIKDQFSSFINYITKKIIDGFSTSSDGSASNWFIIAIYDSSDYQRVWLDNLKEYMIDSKYFDLNFYFKASILFDSSKGFLAKGLLKLYKGETLQSVKDMLNSRNNTKVSVEKIKTLFENLRLDLYKGEVDSKFLDEENPETFLAQLCLVREIDFELILRSFEMTFSNIKFETMYKLFTTITKTYIRPEKSNIWNYITDGRFRELKKELDKFIKEYNTERKSFKFGLSDILYRYNLLGVEEKIFYNYVQTQIIDIYYPQVNTLFYRNKEACRSRNDWAELKGDFNMPQGFKYSKEVEGIIEFKKIILEIDKNLFGTFLRPIIYKAISDELCIKKKDLYKIRYIMTLILSDTYKEYKSVYRFFEELECFLNYNDNIFNFSKLKLFSSNVILLAIVLIILYIYAPIGVFLSGFVLILIGAFEIVRPFNGGVKWNFGIKSFAMALFVFSLFLWFLNLNNTKKQIADTSAQIEKIGIYNTTEVIGIVDKKIGDTIDIKVYTDILKNLYNKK